jgi:hypothetical protein
MDDVQGSNLCPGFHTNRKYLVLTEEEFLGAFTKLRKATINFAMTVRLLSPHIELRSHWTDFHEI